MKISWNGLWNGYLGAHFLYIFDIFSIFQFFPIFMYWSRKIENSRWLFENFRDFSILENFGFLDLDPTLIWPSKYGHNKIWLKLSYIRRVHKERVPVQEARFLPFLGRRGSVLFNVLSLKRREKKECAHQAFFLPGTETLAFLRQLKLYPLHFMISSQ